MKKVLFATAVLALTTLQSCSEHDNEIQQGTSIEFRTLMDKTRASLLSGTNDVRFNSFMVKAFRDKATTFEFMPGTPVFKEAGTWTYAPTKFYPSDGKSVSFFAYAPINDGNLSNMTTNGTTTKFTYILPNDQRLGNTSTDLLVARAKQNTGGVALAFQHALSAATFKAKNANTADELTYVITELVIENLRYKGDFTYGTGTGAVGTWSYDGDPVGYYPAVVSSGVAVEPNAGFKQVLSDNDWLMVLPQTPTWATINDITQKPTSGSYIAVTFNARDGAGKNIYNANQKFYLVPPTSVGFKFEAGKKYVFQITFEKLTGIALSATLTGWEEPTAETPISKSAGVGVNNFNYNDMFGN